MELSLQSVDQDCDNSMPRGPGITSVDPGQFWGEAYIVWGGEA